MGRESAIHFTAWLDAARLNPRWTCDHSDGTISVLITPTLDAGGIHVNGTLDELAKFVADLASVVRELTEREMAVTA